MVRIEVRDWNGQFHNKGVLDRIRRKIEGGQTTGTVLVDLEDAIITAGQLAVIKANYPPHKVKFCGSVATLPVPIPGNALLPEPLGRRQRKRNRRKGNE